MKKKNLKVIKLKPKKDYSYKRKVLITDLTLLMLIGIHDFEKIKKQEVRFNINIDINPSLNHHVYMNRYFTSQFPRIIIIP